MTQQRRDELRDLRALTRQFYSAALNQVGLKFVDIHEGIPERGFPATVLFRRASGSSLMALEVDRFTVLEALLKAEAEFPGSV